jgi:hypothetical protein
MALPPEQGFSVRQEALAAATRALPAGVTALGHTRQGLLARQVPGEAFAQVAASHLAAAGHLSVVNDNAQLLTKASGWLQDIIDKVRFSNGEVQRFDTANAEKLGPDQVTIDKIDEKVGTGWWGKGGAYIVPSELGDHISLRPRDPSVPTAMIPNNVGANGFIVGPGYDVVNPEHTYRREATTTFPFDQARVLAGNELKTDPVPVPWGGDPASESGTKVDAGYGNYVRAYTVTSPDPARFTDIVVNYTIAGEHGFHEGYVIRYGERAEDGTLTLVSYGEGNAGWQHPVSPVHLGTNWMWDRNHDRIIRDITEQLR